MLSKELFQSMVDDVDCTGCGQCCPRDCEYLREGKNCQIHPTQHTINPFYASCELKPMEQVLYFGIFCPPAIEVIETRTLTSISASTENLRFCNQAELEKALSINL